MSAAEYDRAHRWRATAMTWISKTRYALVSFNAHAAPDARYLAAAEAAQLMSNVLDDLAALVPLLRDDTIYDRLTLEKEARDLARALRAARLADLLDETSGRTPEEAEAFLRKAAELRDAG